MEEGAVVRHAIFTALWKYRAEQRTGRDNAERFCDYDNPERVKRSVEKGDPAFIETGDWRVAATATINLSYSIFYVCGLENRRPRSG
jgi:hypothetical protein